MMTVVSQCAQLRCSRLVEGICAGSTLFAAMCDAVVCASTNHLPVLAALAQQRLPC
jgi:hypothetical protein